MTIKRIVFAFGSFLIILESMTYASDDGMIALRQYQEQQLDSLASKLKMPNTSIELLYHSAGISGRPILVLPKEHSKIHSTQELEKLFGM